jgi:hypothetical protein
MTDQMLGGALARKGWLACPATNRLTMFDAKYLHGKLSTTLAGDNFFGFNFCIIVGKK